MKKQTHSQLTFDYAQVLDNYSAISTKKHSQSVLDSISLNCEAEGWIFVIAPEGQITKELCLEYGVDANRIIVFPKKYTSDALLTCQQALLGKNCAGLYLAKDMLPIDQLEFLFDLARQQDVHFETFNSKLLAH